MEIVKTGARLDVENVVKDFNFSTLHKYDLFEKILPMIKQGTYYIRLHDGKIVMPFNAVAPEGHGWLYSHLDNTRNCTVNTQVLFGALKALPMQCINCWKVVVKPRTDRKSVV